LLEWSAPDGCPIDDVDAWAQANPGLGRTVTVQKLRSAMNTARPVDFRTENLCQRVDSLDSAVDPEGWQRCADPTVDQQMAGQLHNMVMAVDVAMGSGHVTAAAAAQLEDGTVLGQVFAEWPSVTEARVGLREAFEKYLPRACAWFPSGPAAVIGAELKEQHLRTIGAQVIDPKDAPPDAPGVVRFTGEDASAACQTLASLVMDRKFRHPDDPLLNAHVTASVRKDMGDGWRVARRGAGDNDAAYAVAGAVHLARSIPRRIDYDILGSVF
jgi:phage terminase large subunit-like protein